MAPSRRRSWWGWGFEDQAIDLAQRQALASGLGSLFGVPGSRAADLQVREPPALGSIDLPAPRVSMPPSLSPIASTDLYHRASHTHGKSFVDVVRAFHGDFSRPPDLVVFPRDECEVSAVLDWCGDHGVAVVPFGGGSSVVGGVSCEVDDGFPAVVSLDLSRLDGVVEIDGTSRSACIGAGAFGPDIEDALRPHGYTLRHFPQSFEHSTLGGWIATRAGGHFATNYTHIDDFVESLRVIAPAGVVETRRLPGSGAGPSPDRLFLGSEGTLGVITQAWMRLQDRPRFTTSAVAHFAGFAQGVVAARGMAQSGLFPSNCRLLDAGEAATAAGVADNTTLLVVGFESADHPVDAWMERAVEICRDAGGRVPEGVKHSSTQGFAGTWRTSFMAAPYWRDALISAGCIAETFETAVTWDRFDALHAAVTGEVRRTLERVCGGGRVTCRFTHVYPDGPAPYFTVIAPSSHGSQIAQWKEIKAAASEAILANGGTITHHHAVGRDHRPWYDRQRPDLFAGVMASAKARLDPAGILNPGVLFDPISSSPPFDTSGGQCCAPPCIGEGDPPSTPSEPPLQSFASPLSDPLRKGGSL